jgi:hypothetical protein
MPGCPGDKLKETVSSATNACRERMRGMRQASGLARAEKSL